MKYRQEYERKDGWTEEIYPQSEYKICCCDCGLVHNLKFDIWKIGRRKTVGASRITEFELLKKLSHKTHQISMKVQRNSRATGQIRRHKP